MPKDTTHERATLFFWEGAVLYTGPLSDTAVHKHNAIQVCMSIKSPFRVMLGGTWQQTNYAAIAANVPHQLDSSSSPIALALLDNDSFLGQNLTMVTARPPSVVDIVSPPTNISEAQNTLRNMIGTMAAAPVLILDSRIERVVQYMADIPEEALRARNLAQDVGLSESRFLHLFTQHMGLPFRRYVLWRRIRKSITQIVKGADLTTAAHAGGFSDLAHFSRTFKQNFGLSPSKLFQDSRNVQVIL